jgi:hypothetical protein
VDNGFATGGMPREHQKTGDMQPKVEPQAQARSSLRLLKTRIHSITIELKKSLNEDIA